MLLYPKSALGTLKGLLLRAREPSSTLRERVGGWVGEAVRSEGESGWVSEAVRSEGGSG